MPSYALQGIGCVQDSTQLPVAMTTETCFVQELCKLDAITIRWYTMMSIGV